MTTSATHQASVQVSMSWDQLYSPWGWQQMGLSPVQRKFELKLAFYQPPNPCLFSWNNIFEFIINGAQPALDSIFDKNSHQKMLAYNILNVEGYTAICSHGIVVEGFYRQASNLRVRVLTCFPFLLLALYLSPPGYAIHIFSVLGNLGPQTVPHNSLLKDIFIWQIS